MNKSTDVKKISNGERRKLIVLSKGRTIPIGYNKLLTIKSNNSSKSLVVHGSNLGSNIGHRLNYNDLNHLYLSSVLTQVLVGLLLGDANIRQPSKKGQPQIQYIQGFIHLSYILHIFTYLAPIVTHLPSLVQTKDLSFYLHLHTRCLACLRPLYNLFICEGKKIVPQNISLWLTPVSLAFWAMDDGSSTPNGFYLNTHSFSYQEQLILQAALLDNFGIICNIHKHASQYKLYIRAQSMATFRLLVYPHFAPSMLYKLYPRTVK